MSNQNGFTSSKESALIVQKTNQLININSDTLTLIVRKGAHILEYLILFILIYINIKEYKNTKIYITSIIFAFIYAIIDEFHQLFIFERSGSIIDCFIDLIGILIGYISIKMINKHKK